jgi:hypothetical protein
MLGFTHFQIVKDFRRRFTSFSLPRLTPNSSSSELLLKLFGMFAFCPDLSQARGGKDCSGRFDKYLLRTIKNLKELLLTYRRYYRLFT